MRALALLGQIAAAVSVGALAVGFGLVLPMLEAGNGLVDANLAKALGQGIALRLGLVCMIACGIVALTASRWVEHRAATTAALGALAFAALDRLVVLPRLYQAWSRVDLVTERPFDRLAEARELAQWHHWLLLATGALIVTVLALAVFRPRRAPVPAPARREEEDPPTRSPAPAAASGLAS